MANRSYSGGTTALVIVLTLVIIIIGVGFFFWMKLIGGGNELQHATDAGNLNVAKQSLKSPSIALSGAEINEFGDLTDSSTNPPQQLDLLMYNRVVGKCVLVAANASAIGTKAALDNAQSELNLVEGPNGIGSRLASKLSNGSNLEQFFIDLSGKNSTRMLSNNDTITPTASESGVSYMARDKASNVYINANQLPPGSTFLSAKNKNGKSNVISETFGSGKNASTKIYLTGYNPLNCGNNLKFTNLPQAVPMRPGQQPHLVDINDFQSLATSPLGGKNTLIPPNAFRSGGTGFDGNRNAGALTMRSTAVVGTLNQDFPVSLPRGYIIVDNTGTPSLYGKPTDLQFKNPISGGGKEADMVLMPPSYVGLVPQSNGDVYGLPGQVEQLISDCNPTAPNAPDTTAIQNDMSTITSTGGSMGGITTAAQAIAAFQSANPPTPIQCIDTNTDPGTSTPNASCQKDYNSIINSYSKPIAQGGNVSADSLMAVEKFKCDVLAARAGVDGSGCGATADNGVCSGLKYYDAKLLSGGAALGDKNGMPPCLPCNFGNASPTLGQLLSISNGTPLSNSGGDLLARLYQILPTASSAEISKVMSSTIPFGQISYIYVPSGKSSFTIDTNPPKFPIIPSLQPDGQPKVTANAPLGYMPSPTSKCPSPMVCYQLAGNLNGTVLNLNDCEGYPHPWDCPSLPANGQNIVQWTPSSGYNNLLGVLRFFNCAQGGGSNWCCPC